MSITNVITLLGGLAMFLYGMRLMGDGLKESSSGALKKIMEKVTGTPLKAFLLGTLMTAVIQSSTATIVITSGLVGAEIISLHQSLGIIIGANVGTTVTGQIIRLLDLDSSGTSFLNLFKPSTLAPLALVIGVLMVMTGAFKGSNKVGQIIIGFGILFSGLLNMTGAVETLTENGLIEGLFSKLGNNPLIGYIIGAAVAFVLQSSSAATGILQAFSTSGMLTFGGIYAVLMGIYLGDCITTAIVINIGAKPNAKRVGLINILFNLSKTALIFIGVNVAHKLGLLDSLWSSTIHSGGIANTNTIFNLVCAILMFPVLGVYEKQSLRLIKDTEEEEKPAELIQLEALNPVFFSTPALAFNACYEVILEMYTLARENIVTAFEMVEGYDEEKAKKLRDNEDMLDKLTDSVGNYLVKLSNSISMDKHVEIMDQYNSVIPEFERLGDHALNILESVETIRSNDAKLSDTAIGELRVIRELIERVLDYTYDAFKQRSVDAAKHIEPLEEVVDDMIDAMKQHHLERLRNGTCSILSGMEYLNMLSDIERMSDICSNVGTATIIRAMPELKNYIHDYVSGLHAGVDEKFNHEYESNHDEFFGKLAEVQ